MQRLIPDPGPTTLEEQFDQLDLVSLALADRPYVVTNFAVTLDGRATIEGRSGAIGSDTDTELLQRLRIHVDAVMIGAGTMRTERYGRMVSDPQARAYRERIGLPHDPLAVLISGSLDLPWDAPLFTSGQGRVLVFTASDAEPPETATSVRVVRHDGGRVDLRSALEYLRTERGIRALLCEGGPHVQAGLVKEGLVDEMFVTIAPKVVGGVAPSMIEGALDDVVGLELVWVLEQSGELYTRYRVAG